MVRNVLEPWHLIILVLLIIIVFGAKRLPDAARSLGRSMRIFKSEVSAMQDDDKPSRASRSTVDGETVTEETTTTTRTERPAPGHPTDHAGSTGTSTTSTTSTGTTAPAGATRGDDYVVVDGVRYKRDHGGDAAPRA
ncbi:Sec-independent protein translocase subunit TatA [Arsenicicoccus sp. oral taxon 190]|uniref:Sec-independent protein translocase subunit TatA n=1 Tax=Arsenicicoccus sp. oral taxon 190 TaxID=1658671 RepID=UPI000679F312|nr:Sec-independent protein translocase subunit TatA [Arsenicicoccus sp. oral taxon 190]AKT51906.1 hypothetical protein ADJ73_12600 [Arsenicicoccus sp. oral taxon 190]